MTQFVGNWFDLSTNNMPQLVLKPAGTAIQPIQIVGNRFSGTGFSVDNSAAAILLDETSGTIDHVLIGDNMFNGSGSFGYKAMVEFIAVASTRRVVMTSNVARYTNKIWQGTPPTNFNQRDNTVTPSTTAEGSVVGTQYSSSSRGCRPTRPGPRWSSPTGWLRLLRS